MHEKRELERASPWTGARDRGLGAEVGDPWKVRVAGARQAGRSTVGAGNPDGRPPPPPTPPRRAGFPERSDLEPRVGCSRRGQPGVASRRRAIPASRARPSGNLCAGTRVGARWRALGFELRASPAATACLKRPARSAAAVTVCQCHVCAAGGGGCNPDWVPSWGGTGACLGLSPYPRDPHRRPMDSARNERLKCPPYLGSAHGQAPPSTPWLAG